MNCGHTRYFESGNRREEAFLSWKNFFGSVFQNTPFLIKLSDGYT